MGAKPISVAVLLTDKDLPLLAQDKQTLPILFAKFFGALHYDITFFDALQGKLPTDPASFDACCITGSKFSVLKPGDWTHKLIDFIRAKSFRKLIGVCYGHQLIAIALGGKVEKKGWHIGVSAVVPCIDEIPVFHARYNHEDHVIHLPPNAKLLGKSTLCENAMFSLDKNILSMQFHPEFTEPYHQKLFKARFENNLEKQTHDYARMTLHHKDSKAIIQQCINDFILGEQ